ncbi:MAG: helix-hairpin-helix domain-containing protein, partial [Candidatus Marinimicrobia bacterium]|nr:helix-hairpin-helix domain-containing protein [Candidatus Neomarinimicrobiota bacterium]
MKTINKLHYSSKRRYIPVGLLIVLLIFSNSFGQLGAGQKIDLNTATQAEIATLPLTPKQQNDIIDWLEYTGPFESIYDLRKIKSIDYDTFLKLKEMIQLSPLFLAESQKRVEDNYYKVERWISDDG